MQIDWLAFTPGPALFGGVLLGLATAIYVILHGRILGVSGIIAGLLSPKTGDWNWRFSLVLGIFSAPFWAVLLFDIHTTSVIEADYLLILIAGLLVGFGAQYGSGCTSGHGICGLSQLSPRSLVATSMFMLAGFLVVFISRHLLGL